MIDLTKIQYRVVVMDESKNQYNIKEYIENLGWEENDGELSVRTSFVAKNDKTSKGYLSKIIKPGCLVGVFATDGASQDEEVARGYVETWNPVEKSGGHTLKCTCYDELYKLQKSQDNRYFPSGTGARCGRWFRPFPVSASPRRFRCFPKARTLYTDHSWLPAHVPARCRRAYRG